MKNKNIILAAMIMVCSLLPANAAAETIAKETVITNTGMNNAAEAATITRRVEEINNMKKSDLSRQEKKELRNELLTLQDRMQSPGVGIYISGGTLILILILLIIFL